VRSTRDVKLVERLIGAGLNPCEVSRRTGIPRSTIRDWAWQGRWLTVVGRDNGDCDRCGGPAHVWAALPSSYAYLLGLYLGDGCLSPGRRGVFHLRIALDDRYPGIIRECRQAIEDLLPRNRVHVQPKRGEQCSDVGVYSKQLPCLFPQHGPGRKHERRIVLEPWQEKIVGERPGALLRGLIHSDGCRFENHVRHGNRLYTYPRYGFSNRSGDIRRIFTDACDRLGVEWRVMNACTISVAQRKSVGLLDAFVGPKS
jgi:hypothetical protein